MFHSLRSRFFLSYLLIMGIILALAAVILFIVLIRNVERLEYGRLQIFINAFTQREARLLSGLNTDALTTVAKRVDNQINVRVLVLDSLGEMLTDSRPAARSLPAETRKKIIQSDEAIIGRFGEGFAEAWLFTAEPIAERRWLVLASPRPTLRALSIWRDDLLVPLFQAGLVALLISALLSWIIAQWVAAPLSQTADAARAVAAGDYEQELAIKGPSEAESMALAFNEMLRRVQSSRQAQRDFVANVSHELKTPLTSIQGFAQAILDGTAEDDEAKRRSAQVIYAESDRLRRLVEDLLDLARIDSGQVRFEFESVDPGMLIQGVIERLSVRAKEAGIEIHTRLPPLPAIRGDGDRLAQVFTNLIDNAIKHSPHHTRVSVHGEVDSGWITIHVDDAGEGIPADELSRIFERFYQLDKARAGGPKRGVGLGLAISREIVQAHGGRLVAQSVIGRGSRFSVQLPIARPDASTLTRRPQ